MAAEQHAPLPALEAVDSESDDDDSMSDVSETSDFRGCCSFFWKALDRCAAKSLLTLFTALSTRSLIKSSVRTLTNRLQVFECFTLGSFDNVVK